MIRKPAIFLDRDGVLSPEKNYVTSINDFEIFSFSREAVKKIHEAGYYAIVITNQSAVARGLLKIEELKKMNSYLIRETNVDAIYYCPHHIRGCIKQYAIACNCRKPKSGLIEKACNEYEIDLENSYFLGDRITDIIAGKTAGICTVLLKSGYDTRISDYDVKPEYVFRNLKEFADELAVGCI